VDGSNDTRGPIDAWRDSTQTGHAPLGGNRTVAFDDDVQKIAGTFRGSTWIENDFDEIVGCGPEVVVPDEVVACDGPIGNSIVLAMESDVEEFVIVCDEGRRLLRRTIGTTNALLGRDAPADEQEIARDVARTQRPIVQPPVDRERPGKFDTGEQRQPRQFHASFAVAVVECNVNRHRTFDVCFERVRFDHELAIGGPRRR